MITFGSQTHPADGAAGVLVTTAERARRSPETAPSRSSWLRERTRREGANAEGSGPGGPARHVGCRHPFEQLDVVTTHNPFAVNDLWLHRETGIPLDRMNPFGCSLVYGHPQGPTGARALAELIEALALRGGGTGLFTGCAAGDTGAALVLRVDG